MESNRTLAENERERKTEIEFSIDSFDFAKKMRVGDKGQMDIQGTISMERLEDGESIKTLKISQAKLKKSARMQ